MRSTFIKLLSLMLMIGLLMSAMSVSATYDYDENWPPVENPHMGPCTFGWVKVLSEPTCTTEGSELYNCTQCSNYYISPIPATGHNYIDGFCANCGEQPSKTVHIWVTQDWSKVHTYTWAPEAFGIWPGIAPIENGDWYTISLTGTNLIVNDGDTKKTDDLVLPNWEEIWILVDQNGDVTMSPSPLNTPEETPLPEKPLYTVVGNTPWMGNWDVESYDGLMTEAEPNIYEVTFLNVEPGEYQFKVVRDHSWANSWGGAYGDNIILSVRELTNITIRFDNTQTEPSIKVTYNYNRLGDFDGDGVHNIGDVARLFAHVRGKNLLDEALLEKADTNRDGKINLGDVAKLFAAVRKHTLLETIPTK